MRFLVLATIAIATAAAVAPAKAQTYDPNYPVCMEVYTPINYYDCHFTSIHQCKATASGRAAECLLNPYFANSSEDPPLRRRRHRHAY